MRKKIKFHLYLVGGVSILLTTIFTMLISYGLIKQQTQKDLRNYGQLLVDNYMFGNQSNPHEKIKSLDVRVTLIGSEGKVIYDSKTDIDKMDNHKNRPEVIDAQKTGIGEAIRYSNTLADDTFYYAILLEDGNILRVSKQIHSVWNLFLGVFPLVISIGTMVFLLCLLLSNALTDRIIKPIEKMADNINSLENSVAYVELIPFAKKLKNKTYIF